MASPSEPEVEGAPVCSPVVSVTVRNLPGEVLLECEALGLADLREKLQQATGTLIALQKLVVHGGDEDGRVLGGTDELPSGDLLMLHDETPLSTWDHASNPAKKYLVVDDGVVKCPGLQTDFVNVLTKEPLRAGAHYFQFVIHCMNDEQWCGLVDNQSQAGSRVGGRSLNGWFYYCGRRRSSGRDEIFSSFGGETLSDGKGALHARGTPMVEFKKPAPGDAVGMLVDLNAGAVAFDLNGEHQGGCTIPKTPKYLLTHVDTPDDHVELRKSPVAGAPPASMEKIQQLCSSDA